MMWRSIFFAPATFPFAIIPVIPNFPLFYVLWRAWSHYKAWRGALYLEQLLKLGMIVEKPSDPLTEVYKSKGAITGKEGEENLAPDHTSTPSPSSSASTSTTTSVSGASAQGAANVPPQAAGKSAAPDGTATPSEMIYPSSSSSSSTSSSSSSSASSSASAAAAPAPSKSDKKTKPRHANLLLRPNQVPLLTKTFGLTKTEIIDINRAVEQANARAVKASQAESEGKPPVVPGGKAEPPKGEKAGTEWRGNLHR